MATEVSERVREVIGAAEAAASAIRHEADEHAQTCRRAAEDEARRLVDDARGEAEALLAERMRRISSLSDSIIERSEALLGRIGKAEEVRRELEALVAALGQSAAQLARDAAADIAAAPPDEEAAEPRNPAVDDSPSETSAAEPPASEPETQDPPADGQMPSTEAEPADADEDSPAEVEVVSDVRIVEDEPREKEEEPVAAAAAIEDAVVEDPLADGDDQILGARLVALQMAVAGGNRGEVEAHLRRAFELPDLDSILDDVFGPGTDSSKRVVWPSAADA